MVKNPPPVQEMQEIQVRSLGLGRSPGGESMAPTLEFLPGKSHGQRSLGGLQCVGPQRVRHD